MSSSQQPEVQSPVRTRSPVERRIVWSLIGMLLVVVALEAQARWGYDRSLAWLESEIPKEEAGPLLADAQRSMSGFARTREVRSGESFQVVYRWPSLIRRYELALEVGPDGRVASVITSAPPEQGRAGPTMTPEQRDASIPRPAQGFAQPLPGVVALLTHELEPQRGMPQKNPQFAKVGRGALARELVRQAFLLSAQEELQQFVRDQSLNDDVGTDANPQAFPFEVRTELNEGGMLIIEVIYNRLGQPIVRKKFPSFSLDTARSYETLLEYVEGLSRNEFPALLGECGFQGQRNAYHETAPVPEELAAKLDQLDELTQLSAVRGLHELIRLQGESPERLAALSRGYANLGSLTEFHWQLHSKVYKARALLYAQRLLAASKGSPWSLAHRGYAWALVGRPASGLVDLRAAAASADFVGDAVPEWVTCARAYCEYDVAQLDQVKGAAKSLAVYLRLLSGDANGNSQEYLDLAQALGRSAPGCARALFFLCNVNQLGVARQVSEEAFQASWPAIYRRLIQTGELPADLLPLVQKHSQSRTPRDDEPRDRAQIIQLLKAASEDRAGPSVAASGRLLEEISFLQAAYQHKVQRTMLGLPVDDLVEVLASTAPQHPYIEHLRCGVTSPDQAKAAFIKLDGSIRPFELDFNASEIIYDASRLDPHQRYKRLYAQSINHLDVLQWDLLLEMGASDFTGRRDLLLELLTGVSPQLPQVAAWNIQAHGLENVAAAKEVEGRFPKSASVWQALSEWYQSRKDFADAERSLQRRIAIARDVGSYRLLANLQLVTSGRKQWQQTLDKALTVPALGLEHASIQSDVAYYLMSRNEWRQALPYAEGAASSYSAWGLQCAAKCYEGLGRYTRAEQLIEACAERYEDTSLDWHFWCLRTGRGNSEAAKRKAQEYLAKIEQQVPAMYWQAGIYYLAEKQFDEARTYFKRAWGVDNGNYVRLHLATLEDRQQDLDEAKKWVTMIAFSPEGGELYSEVAKLMLADLTDPSQPRLDSGRLRQLLMSADDGEATNFYYFVGRFLENRGRKEEGLEYLRLAASSPQFQKLCCLLATLELRERGETIPPRRPFELGGDLEDGALLKLELRDRWAGRQYAEIVASITQALAEHPSLTFLLAERGEAWARQGNYRESISDWEQALQHDPNNQWVHHELAMTLAACHDPQLRDPPKALVHAQRAYDLATSQDWTNSTCLAIALAANGQFDKAVAQQENALVDWPRKDLQAGKDRLELFQNHQPYVRKPPVPAKAE